MSNTDNAFSDLLDLMKNRYSTVKYYDSLESSDALAAISNVVVTVSEDVERTAGTDTGRTLKVTCPWASDLATKYLMNSVRGYRHQPFEATNAILDPAMELGDAVHVGGVNGFICSMETKFGGLYRATISAPADEEIDHEFPYVEKQERAVTRKIKQLSAEMKIQASEISAEVVKQTGGNRKSFAWSLKSSGFTLTANGVDVFKVNKNGADIQGKITATNGKIGGFDIKSNRLSYNGQTWNGKLAKGIYIGIKGIQLGKNFKVDLQGNLEASSGKFTGNVYANKILSGVDANTGTDYGTFSGSGISPGSITGSKVAGSTLGTGNMVNGILNSLSYADFAHGVFNDWNSAPVIRCESLRVKDKYFAPITIYYKNAGGSTSYVTVLGYR